VLLVFHHPWLFHSGLNTSLFSRSFSAQPSFSSSGLTPRIPQTVYRYFWAYLFFTFLVFPFFQFLVVGSVQQIKPTHVSFCLHVKIASRIVSYRSCTGNTIITTAHQVNLIFISSVKSSLIPLHKITNKQINNSNVYTWLIFAVCETNIQRPKNDKNHTLL